MQEKRVKMVKMAKQVLGKKIEALKKDYNCNEKTGHLPVFNSIFPHIYVFCRKVA